MINKMWADYEDDDEDIQYTTLPWVLSNKTWSEVVRGNTIQPEKDTLCPGDPVGIKSVQYVLMSATQMSLSHFHTAGMSETMLGVDVKPSIADAMNKRYSKDNTSMMFDVENTDIFSIREKIVNAKVMDFVKSIGSSVTELPVHENIWYKASNKEMGSKTVLRIYIDYWKMKHYNLTLSKIAEKIYSDCEWDVSPDFMGMIDISIPNSYLNIWLSKLETTICGTTNILSCEQYGDNEVVTRGSDIIAVSRIKEVNKRTLISNNVSDIEKYFGIEAANLVLKTLIQSPTISNFMTRTGTVLPFTKSSEEVSNRGLLFSLGFERPKDDIKKALNDACEIKEGQSIYNDIMMGRDPINNFSILTKPS